MAPSNGTIFCELGDDGAPNTDDTCTFTCDDNFMMRSGDATRTCQRDMTWTGSNVECTAGNVCN